MGNGQLISNMFQLKVIDYNNPNTVLEGENPTSVICSQGSHYLNRTIIERAAFSFFN